MIDEEIVARARKLKEEIQQGIEKHGRTVNQAGETIYAYEVDGKGNGTIMDDSNVPNLISAPYLGYGKLDEPTYLATRKTLLSSENPYFMKENLPRGLVLPIHQKIMFGRSLWRWKG